MTRFFSVGIDRFQKRNIIFLNKGYEIDVITHTNNKHLLAGVSFLVWMFFNRKQVALKNMGHDLFK